MDAITLDIAGRRLRAEGCGVGGMLRGMAGFRVFETDTGGGASKEAAWTVRFGAGDDATVRLEEKYKRSVTLHSFELEIDHSHCCLGVCEGGYTVRIWHDGGGRPPLTFFVDPVAKRAEATATDEVSWLRFGLWMVFTLLAAPEGLTPIHASTVVWGGRAVLCLGESGTGKSTHTRLWLENVAGSRLLNDDSPIIGVGDGCTMAYGSPWSGKTPCYHNEHVAVAAIVRLSQAPHNKIRRLGAVQALGALYPSCPPALAYDSGYTDHIVALLSKVIERTPIYHLECLPDREAALLCHDTIFGNEK